MNNFMKNLEQKVIKSLELPEEVLLNKLQVNMISNSKITIQNHKGIICYSKEIIKINSNDGLLTINGEELNISSLITEEIIITGKIISFEFLI